MIGVVLFGMYVAVGFHLARFGNVTKVDPTDKTVPEIPPLAKAIIVAVLAVLWPIVFASAFAAGWKIRVERK